MEVVPLCENPKAPNGEAWDPLEEGELDEGMMIAAQRREIRNILKSYTGYWDLFAELFQNALDAVERRANQDETGDYEPRVWVHVDLAESLVAVTDNGCGMDRNQFRQFLRPNYSFKQGDTRGNKGVGATYLAYGFNHLEVATKAMPALGGGTMSGVLRQGRAWVEDRSESVPRPKVEPADPWHDKFTHLDAGTSMVIRLTGSVFLEILRFGSGAVVGLLGGKATE